MDRSLFSFLSQYALTIETDRILATSANLAGRIAVKLVTAWQTSKRRSIKGHHEYPDQTLILGIQLKQLVGCFRRMSRLVNALRFAVLA